MTFETIIKVLMLAIFTSSIFFFALAVGRACDIQPGYMLTFHPRDFPTPPDALYGTKSECAAAGKRALRLTPKSKPLAYGCIRIMSTA